MPFGLLEVKLVPVRSCECIFKMQFHLGRYCRFTKLIRPFAASFQKKNTIRFESGFTAGLGAIRRFIVRPARDGTRRHLARPQTVDVRRANPRPNGFINGCWPRMKRRKAGEGGGGGSAAKPNARLSFHPRFPKLAISHLSHQTSSTGGTKGGRPCPDGMRGSWKGRWVKLRPQKMSHPVRNIKGSDFYPVPVASVDLVLKSIASPPMARSYFKERKLYRKLATRKPKRCLKNMLI